MSNLWFNVQFGTWFWQWERNSFNISLTQSEYVVRNPHLRQFKVLSAFGVFFD